MDKEAIRFTTIIILFFISGLWIPLISIFSFSFFISYLFEYLSGKHPVQKGKTAVVVTGCSTGIGKSAAVFLAKKGVIVFASVRKEEDAEKLKKIDQNIIPFILEVTNSEQIKESVVFIKNKVESMGLYLIGIFNNAAFSDECFMELIQKKRLIKLMDVNCLSQIEVASAFLPLLRQYRSPRIEPRVVFNSSMTAWFSLVYNGGYSGTKRGLEGMCDSLRQEVKGLGIKVILIEPGAIKTDIYNNIKSNKDRSLQETTEISQLDEQSKRYYTKLYQMCIGMAQRMEKDAGPTSLTDAAIDKAFFGVYPSARYLVGYDAVLFYYAHWLPESIADRLFRVADFGHQTLKKINL